MNLEREKEIILRIKELESEELRRKSNDKLSKYNIGKNRIFSKNGLTVTLMPGQGIFVMEE